MPRSGCAVAEHLAARRRDQAGQDAQQRRLAAARRPEHRDDLAGADREAESRSTTSSRPSRSNVLETPRTSAIGASSVFSSAPLTANDVT